ncbi:glycoside hydrolase superfamily [Cantharellus anzutake]|uniref:glycoside hydrolase superfamily n=1 Tax=Cantharellus anzutake TaxID=1750568 RepID=UPI001906EDB0|nr:glycoside hydrolase superfamily [Cantharellus anzutake]KAF8328854.1 glycoside hydrolase superfamily [Cantharellus anzutake]
MLSYASPVPLVLFLNLLSLSKAAAYDEQCNSNLVTYWGQNSYGAANSVDNANWQKRLSHYCQDDTINAIPIAFLNVFSDGTGNPQINLANTCNDLCFSGTQLLNCSFLSADITTCQSKGKLVTLSLGGATGGGPADAAFADKIWNMFLGGSSSTRPFGPAVLDGVDLDIEGGLNSYDAFVNQLREHFSRARKKYYMWVRRPPRAFSLFLMLFPSTAAPQCPYPDSYVGSSINGAKFDALYVQFYNNPCSVCHYGESAWNFGTWDWWAKNVSPNPDIKIFLGVPASATAASSGYVSSSQLTSIIRALRSSFPSFGGVMMWDASQAHANGRYDQSVKGALSNGGSCGGFVYPACDAPQWSSTGSYPPGSRITYQGYVWTARYYGSGAPSGSDIGSWVPAYACRESSATLASSNFSSPKTITIGTRTSSSDGICSLRLCTGSRCPQCH